MSIVHRLPDEIVKSVLNEKDYNIVESFLDIRGRTGSRTKKGFKSNIFQFFIFVNKNSILSIEEEDCENYITNIDNKNLKYSTKKTKRSNIFSFFKYYERKIRRTHPTYYNPMPTLEECNFSADNPLSIEEEERKKKESLLSLPQLNEILLHSKFKSEKFFIASLLMIFCGMRISECFSIRRVNIDLENRYLMTGMEENARKSNKKGNNPLYFCFPQKIALFLKEYLLRLQIENPDSLWLFPGSKTNHLLECHYQAYLKHDFDFPAKAHSFRRTIETLQLNSTNNVPLHIVESLSNHIVSSVVMKHYNIASIGERRTLYDKYLPKEYIEILTFLNKL